jgi:hypothetical protein
VIGEMTEQLVESDPCVLLAEPFRCRPTRVASSGQKRVELAKSFLGPAELENTFADPSNEKMWIGANRAPVPVAETMRDSP